MPRKFPRLSTPDGRYFIIRGRLWRLANPNLSDVDRERHVSTLMAARRAIAAAKRAGDAKGEEEAHATVDRAKRALGERGSVWWTDGAPDYNRKMARNTPYADWYSEAQDSDGASNEAPADRAGPLGVARELPLNGVG